MRDAALEVHRLRRLLLKTAGTGCALGPLLAGGLLTPLRVLAADWNRPAFTATNLPDALKAAGVTGSVESVGIVIRAPDVAENGAQVAIEIVSSIPASQSILVFVDKNPMPLAASLSFANGAVPRARLQLKMAESSRIRVLVKAADGKIYHASRDVRVTLGGCGA